MPRESSHQPAVARSPHRRPTPSPDRGRPDIYGSRNMEGYGPGISRGGGRRIFL